MLVVDKIVERSLGPNRFSRGCVRKHESKHFPCISDPTSNKMVLWFINLIDFVV